MNQRFRTTRSRALTSASAVLGATVLVAGLALTQGTANASAPAVVKVVPKIHVATVKVGKVLVTVKGKTIYAFAHDLKGKSRCTGVCLQYWPAVPASTAPKPKTKGITAKFGTFKRSNGFKQLTINGWPAYTYAGDTAKGQINGQGANAAGGRWWVVSPNGKWNKKIPVTPTASPTPSSTATPTSTPTSTPTATPTYRPPAL
jgi:predicted lipoprotein with Yx(FWY)xxD motif